MPAQNKTSLVKTEKRVAIQSVTSQKARLILIQPFNVVRRAILRRAAFSTLSAIVVLMLCGGGSQRVTAQSAGTNQITVIGVASASTRPDIATFVVGTETVSTDILTSIDQVDSAIDSIQSALERTGVEPNDIEVLAIQVTPEDLLDSRTGSVSGRMYYRVRSAMRVVTRDVNTIRAVINAVIDAGANGIGDYAFGIQDSTALEQAARAAAMENAQLRAEALATGLNLEIQDVAVVSETILINGDRSALSPNGFWITGASGGAFPADAGRAVVTAQVTVTFRAHP